MENKTITVQLEQDLINELQRFWMDYKTRQNTIMDYFDMHKFDTDVSCLDSVVFKHYHKLLEEAFLEYDLYSKKIVDKYTPAEVKGKNYRWEVHFDDDTIEFILQ